MHNRPFRQLGLLSAIVAINVACSGTTEAQEPTSGTLVVTNKGDHTATILDVASGRAVATVPVGNGPHEVAMSNDGRFAVATNYGDQSPNNTLTLIDVARATPIRTIDLGRFSRPHGAIFLPGDSLIAVTSESTRSVVLVRPSDGTVAATISTNQESSHMVTFMANDGRAYTSNIRSGTITELNLLNRTTGRITSVPEQPEAIQINPAGSEVWVGSNARGTVSVFNAIDGSVRGTLTGFSFPYRIAFTPNGRLAAIPDLNNNDIRFFDTRSLEQVGRIALPGGGPEGIVIVNNNTAYLSLTTRDVVAVLDLENFTVLRELPTGDRPDGIGYSEITTQ